MSFPTRAFPFTSAAAPTYPDAADVRAGTVYDSTVGTLDLPSVDDVRLDVTFDNSTKVGTLIVDGGGSDGSGWHERTGWK